MPAHNSTDAQRGSVSEHTEPRFLIIGQVTRPHGVKGEVRVTVYTDLPERFTWLKQVYVGANVDSDSPQLIAVEKVRVERAGVLLKLQGYDDRDAAENLRKMWLFVAREEAIPLAEGEYFLYQLQGLAVYSHEGELLGKLTEILELPAHRVYGIHGDYGEILVPDNPELVLEIDLNAGKMVIQLLPGMIA